MRQLHFVGVTDDHAGLILAERSDAKAGTAVIAITDELRVAIGDRPADGSPRRWKGERSSGSRFASSRLRPREIQDRLRLGRTVAQVAEEAGVDIDWVERFSGPIIAEQHAAVARAKELTFHAGRKGPSDRPLGDAVSRNLLAKGMRQSVDEVAGGWSAFQHQGSEWVVAYWYLQRGRQVEATWIADLATGSLLAVNRAAGALAFVGEDDASAGGGDPSDTGSGDPSLDGGRPGRSGLGATGATHPGSDAPSPAGGNAGGKVAAAGGSKGAGERGGRGALRAVAATSPRPAEKRAAATGGSPSGPARKRRRRAGDEASEEADRRQPHLPGVEP